MGLSDVVRRPPTPGGHRHTSRARSTERFVISDVVQPEVPIALCRRPLDVTKGGQVSLDRRQDLLAVHGPLV